MPRSRGCFLNFHLKHLVAYEQVAWGQILESNKSQIKSDVGLCTFPVELVVGLRISCSQAAKLFLNSKPWISSQLRGKVGSSFISSDSDFLMKCHTVGDH